ncbi:MAG: peptidylprolyl isomerase [Chromatiaceae bacterium]
MQLEEPNRLRRCAYFVGALIIMMGSMAQAQDNGSTGQNAVETATGTPSKPTDGEGPPRRVVPVARVGGKTINYDFVWEYVQRNPNHLAFFGTNAGRTSVLREIIEMYLINRAARERAGLDEDEKGESLKVAVNQLNDELFKPDEFTEEQLQAAYEERKASFGVPSSVRIREIFFPFPEGATSEAKATTRAQAEAALQRARDGESFEALARELAHADALRILGGDQGYVSLSQFPHLAKATAGMTEGALSGVIELPGGYQIFQFLGRREGVGVPYDQAREQLQGQLWKESQERKKAEFLRQYANKVGVEILLPELRMAWPSEGLESSSR